MECTQIVSGLDPLRDDFETERNAEVQYGLNHDALVPAAGQASHEAPVDLDPTSVELTQRSQRRVTDAEIVERDTYASVGQARRAAQG